LVDSSKNDHVGQSRKKRKKWQLNNSVAFKHLAEVVSSNSLPCRQFEAMPTIKAGHR